MSHRRPKGPANAGFYALFVAGLLTASCAPSVDLRQALQVTDVSTGWFDAGIVDGKNKLVPSLTFRLRNGSGAEVEGVALNVVFRDSGTAEIHEEVFKQRVALDNRQTELITVRSQIGHTGDPPQTRLEMLQHSGFHDLDAEIMVRQAAAQWVQLHKVRVERKLLTQ
jgi:hypothetical protein